MEDTHHIAIIKKCLKKLPVTGMVEREHWFQFKYRVTGIKFNDDTYSWNKCLKINVEVSDKYWSTTTKKWIKVFTGAGTDPLGLWFNYTF